eukprot:7140728-Pyramimonas_sp.AAC.1
MAYLRLGNHGISCFDVVSRAGADNLHRPQDSARERFLRHRALQELMRCTEFSEKTADPNRFCFDAPSVVKFDGKSMCPSTK